MKTVIPTYNISLNTLALLSGKNIDYDTIAIDLTGKKYVKETAFNLIKLACYNDWSSYDGRRQAVIHHTNFAQKVPIPINIREGIYFFPTHSPYNIDNSWIAYHHILKIDKVPKHLATTHNQSIIYFKNGETLILNISFHILKTQFERTLQCLFHIEGVGGLKRLFPW